MLEAEVTLLVMETVSAVIFEVGMSRLFETRMSMMLLEAGVSLLLTGTGMSMMLLEACVFLLLKGMGMSMMLLEAVFPCY